LVWVTLASSAGPAAFACPAEEFEGQYRERYLADVAGAPVLLELRQRSDDVKIHVGGTQGYWSNGPGGRNGVDYVFLDASQDGDTELCFYSVFDYSTAGIVDVQATRIEEGELDAYR